MTDKNYADGSLIFQNKGIKLIEDEYKKLTDKPKELFDRMHPDISKIKFEQQKHAFALCYASNRR